MDEEMDDKKKIKIGIAGLIGITVLTVIGLIVKHIFFI